MKRCIISIDLGIKNLGYSVISYSKIGKLNFSDIKINFGIYDISKCIPKKVNVVNGRCAALFKFFADIIENFTVDTVIIERQVSRNVMAMELMYATTAIAMFYCDDVVIFDPKNKFNKLNIEYSTESKKHKKQSSSYARNLIESEFSDMLNEFDSYSKKDDISDSLNQCFVWMIENEFLNVKKSDFVRIITKTGNNTGLKLIRNKEGKIELINSKKTTELKDKDESMKVDELNGNVNLEPSKQPVRGILLNSKKTIELKDKSESMKVDALDEKMNDLKMRLLSRVNVNEVEEQNDSKNDSNENSNENSKNSSKINSNDGSNQIPSIKLLMLDLPSNEAYDEDDEFVEPTRHEYSDEYEYYEEEEEDYED